MSDDATRLGRAVHARAHRAAPGGRPATAVTGGVAAAAVAFAAEASAARVLPRAPLSRRRAGTTAGALYPRDVAVHRPREVLAAGPMLRAHERPARGTA